jgi:prepilin-type N-terminal cleavage/methylation domain-containing protein
MRDRSQNAGVTMIELLVVLAIFGVVIAQALALFTVQHAAYNDTERSIEIQDDVRLVADAVLSDVRMAGFMLPRVAGIASIDGGTGAADVLCTSNADVMDEARIATALERFDRARASAAVSNGATSVQLVASHMDVDGDGGNDFTDGDGIILADGTSSHCARITGITGATVSFTPATPAGFSLTTTTGRVAPSVIWQVSGTDLIRNGIRIANRVEDLQAEYGVDGDGDGQLGVGEFPIHDLNGNDPTAILSIRISVITRADREDEDVQNSGRPAAGNRSAGAADGFRRRRNTTSVIPRNLL